MAVDFTEDNSWKESRIAFTSNSYDSCDRCGGDYGAMRPQEIKIGDDVKYVCKSCNNEAVRWLNRPKEINRKYRMGMTG